MLTKEKMTGILKKMMKLKKGKQFFYKIVKERYVSNYWCNG